MRKAAQDRVIVLVSGQRAKIPQDRWEVMPASERVEALMEQSLDNCRGILDIPLEAAVMSPNVMTGKVQVIRAILTCVTRVGMESARLVRMQDELLQGLIDDFATVPGLDPGGVEEKD